MLFLLVLRCGKHKPKLQDNDLIGGVASQSFLKASNNRSIFLVLMRMEAEATVQQIQTCLSTLRAIKPGEVYASESPLYSLGDAMAFVELTYENALDAIQQRDNDMVSQWLEMTKLAQEYIKVLTLYLEQDPVALCPESHEGATVDTNTTSEATTTADHEVDHLAEPGLEEWSQAAVLDFEIHDSSSLDDDKPAPTPKNRESWQMDPIVTKTFSQKHVTEEETREDVYDLVILDLVPKSAGGRDPVEEEAVFDEALPRSKAWGTRVAPIGTGAPGRLELSDAVEEVPSSPIWKAMKVFEACDPKQRLGGSRMKPRSRRSRKLSKVWSSSR